MYAAELQRAEKRLEMVKSLIERSAIYRSRSAKVALFSGLITLAVSGGMIWYFLNYAGLTPRRFVLIWLGVLILIMALGFFIWCREEQQIVSEGFSWKRFKFVWDSIFPCFLAAAGLTFWHALVIYEIAPVIIYWMIFYGLALLSLEEYAPKALMILGWAFVIAGLLTAPIFYLDLSWHGAGPVDGAFEMGCTFGLFHLVYAICAWPRSRDDLRKLKISNEN